MNTLKKIKDNLNKRLNLLLNQNRSRRQEAMVFDLANVAFGILGLFGISFTVMYQFSYVMFVCSIGLMVFAIIFEAARKSSV